MSELENGSSPVVAVADDDLVDALAESTFTVMAILNRLGAEHDLSLTQLRVLAILRDRERVRMTHLAAHLGLEKSTLTGLVDRAERRRLLTRSRTPEDGRAVDVVLTAEGRALADRVHTAFASAVAGLTQTLTAAERRRLAGLLRRIVGAGTAPEVR